MHQEGSRWCVRLSFKKKAWSKSLTVALFIAIIFMIVALGKAVMKETAPFSALLSWLGKTPFRDLVVEPCLADLSLLCNSIDQSHISTISADDINIWLEIHHGPKIATDISISGNQWLLSIPSINYPAFATNWLDFVGEMGLQNCFSPHLMVEFDYQASGYCLMGLFVTPGLATLSLEALMSSIKFYAQSRRLDLKNPLSSLAFAEGMNGIRLIVEQLGMPSVIGFVDRGKSVVKLLIPIGLDKLMQCYNFCLTHYSDLIIHEMKSLDFFEVMLKNLFERNKKIRISLDYDLEEGRLSEKLAFECFPFSKADTTQDKAGKDRSANSKYPLAFDSYFRGYATSVNMESNLPYGQKLVSLNFVEEQIMLLAHNHRKLTLSFFTSEVKDYIMMRSLIPPSSGTISPPSSVHSEA